MDVSSKLMCNPAMSLLAEDARLSFMRPSLLTSLWACNDTIRKPIKRNDQFVNSKSYIKIEKMKVWRRYADVKFMNH